MITDWTTLGVDPKDYRGSRLLYEQLCYLNSQQKDRQMITEHEFYTRQALLDIDFTDWIQSN